ncbi:M23 family metallopeptidase [Varunaivibrio sulfuroxidans]|uniref:Murein DD-endopeptidase MepM/ murein hydrolase activator NlpD n=1 Tax=Varunaivibrio sulfuroxidans TaxID=1773489 RepID=A0A4R3J5T5_9PROT|nr:M23 family metallopeptidase [Varunaivibrio sulfuroxidans]TCS60634.1 murein DD-endopeptidase MepM/ murein hydrolase activator NlpD [Varunaivibrio sulfuroxidans]WES30123.1 M23 family metallopeptidase [Varunaivibrio sulfuroxidans]
MSPYRSTFSRHVRLHAAFLTALGILVASPLQAARPDVRLKGTFSQGGMVIGHAPPGTAVTLDGRTLLVSPGGDFVFGFGRDAKPTAHLELTLGDGVRESRTLRVASRKYRIQRIDGLAKRKVTPNPKDIAHIKADNAKIKKVRTLNTPVPYFLQGFSWPVTGPISGVFGSQRVLNGIPKNPHNGVDIAAPRGSVITAPAPGVVRLAVPNMFYTGKTLMIDHGFAITSVYAHMDKILVHDGEKVRRGQPIGVVGQSGRATGPHLHWGVTWFSTHLDPQLLAGPMPKKGK